MGNSASATPTTNELLRAVPFALVIGVICAVTLMALSWVAERLQVVIWEVLPAAWGLETPDGVPWWWTIGILTLTGLLVGATVRWAPGHAGHDPATTGMIAPPLPPRALPGLALALALGLAGGVSLGPENPIIALNVALAVWLLSSRGRPEAEPNVPVVLATSGTIGALFATPVAAAILITEAFAERGADGRRLFDRLFLPLVSAGAGSVTMYAVGAPTFAVELEPYADPSAWDLLAAPAVAIVAVLLVSLGAYALPHVHRAFHAIGSPVLALGLGGLVLGVLGVLGGPLTLFKGLEEMKELTASADDLAWSQLLVVGVVKIAALLVATAAGFRGGRIFPAVFIGVALGLAAAQLVPTVHPAVAVAGGVLGAVIAVDRDGWIALFMAAVVVGDVGLLPLLCLSLAPLWLVARVLPEMQAAPPADGRPEFAALAGRR
ncbi:ion channel protein [Microbacterium halophytorum]|uniref:ion channel protein n=1 Tax=Microbacterium halophytorum TaxID=2067568 RepID=UPI0018E084CB|nr:ion channel protein [Microbacterium halophytorum]